MFTQILLSPYKLNLVHLGQQYIYILFNKNTNCLRERIPVYLNIVISSHIYSNDSIHLLLFPLVHISDII